MQKLKEPKRRWSCNPLSGGKGFALAFSLLAICFGVFAGIMKIIELGRAGDFERQSTMVLSAVVIGVVVGLGVAFLASTPIIVSALTITRKRNLLAKYPGSAVAVVGRVEMPVLRDGSSWSDKKFATDIRILVVEGGELSLWGGLFKLRELGVVATASFMSVSLAQAESPDRVCVVCQSTDWSTPLRFSLLSQGRWSSRWAKVSETELFVEQVNARRPSA